MGNLLTTRACSWSTLSLNGLKVVGPTPSGNLIFIYFFGINTLFHNRSRWRNNPEPTGAVSIILARISPDEVSIVVSSVVTEKLYSNPTILKVPSVFVV